jgi:hypothetical protein
MTTTQFTIDQLNENIVKECRAYAISKTKGTRHDASEVEGTLIEKVYFYILDKPQYHNIKGLRQVIQSRGRNYFNDQVKHNGVLPFTCYETKEDDGVSQLDTMLRQKTDPLEIQVEKEENMNNLLNSLTIRQRCVVELTAGIMDSLTPDQRRIAIAIIESKSVCKKKGHDGDNCTCQFEIFFTVPDIGKILGCSPRTIDNELKRVKEGN